MNNNINSIDINQKKETIFRLVSFFDIFDFPLTSFEIWKYLELKCDLVEVDSVLQKMKQSGELDFLNSFYFKKDRSEIVKTRLKRYNYAERKFKRTFFVSQIFKFIPWIKLVAVGNLIGASNLRDKSDIDIFIVAQEGRLWLTRFFTTVLMKLARMRPSPGDEQDKICLSFYISDRNLNLKNLMLNDADLYFIYWLACLNPVSDREKTYEKLISENKWLEESLPNWQLRASGTRHEVINLKNSLYQKIFDSFFGWLEPIFMKIQIKYLPAKIKNEMNKNTCVVLDQEIIKLHTNDRREEFLRRFKT